MIKCYRMIDEEGKDTFYCEEKVCTFRSQVPELIFKHFKECTDDPCEICVKQLEELINKENF